MSDSDDDTRDADVQALSRDGGFDPELKKLLEDVEKLEAENPELFNEEPGEALLFNPYGHPRDFVLDGRTVGSHRLVLDPETATGTYESELVLNGVVPLLSWQRASFAPPPRTFGPRIPAKETVWGEDLVTFTDGWGFPKLVLDVDEVKLHPESDLGKTLPEAIVHLTLSPTSDGRTRMQFALKIWKSYEIHLDHAIALQRAVARRVEAIGTSGQRFADAWDAVKARGFTGDPAEDRVLEVKEAIESAVAFVEGHAERVKDGIEARMHLFESGLELKGELKATWSDPEAKTLDVSVLADLPEVDIREVTLEPEPEGWLAFWKTLGEVEVGDRSLDTAFLIEGDSAAGPTIVHAKPELLTCAEYGGRVRLGGKDVRVRVFEVPSDPETLGRVLASVIELWRRTAVFRAGLQHPGDPTVLG